jgi:hypothetical protein
MNETDLDEIYTELCRAVTAYGPDGASEFLARFALLAAHEIDDVGKLRRLLAAATRPAAEPSTIVRS